MLTHHSPTPPHQHTDVCWCGGAVLRRVNAGPAGGRLPRAVSVAVLPSVRLLPAVAIRPLTLTDSPLIE